MTVWRPITAEGAGYASLLSDAIAATEAANPDLLWPVDEGVQFVVSDYSGQHRQATHETHAFLVTTDEALADWLPSWSAFARNGCRTDDVSRSNNCVNQSDAAPTRTFCNLSDD